MTESREIEIPVEICANAHQWRSTHGISDVQVTPSLGMQKIEIVITNDAGESSVIASTNRLDTSNRVFCTNLGGYEEARRVLTVSESMAVSRLCFSVGANTFAIDPTDLGCLAAARAFHETRGRPKYEEGCVGTTPDGDMLIERWPISLAMPATE